MEKRLLESKRRRRDKKGERKKEYIGGTRGPGLPRRKEKLVSGSRAARLRTLLWTVDSTAI